MYKIRKEQVHTNTDTRLRRCIEDDEIPRHRWLALTAQSSLVLKLLLVVINLKFILYLLAAVKVNSGSPPIIQICTHMSIRQGMFYTLAITSLSCYKLFVFFYTMISYKLKYHGGHRWISIKNLFAVVFIFINVH